MVNALRHSNIHIMPPSNARPTFEKLNAIAFKTGCKILRQDMPHVFRKIFPSLNELSVASKRRYEDINHSIPSGQLQ